MDDLVVITDQNNRWLRVQRDLVSELGISPTPESYKDHRYYYLEEDDASDFIQMYFNGSNPQYQEFEISDFKRYCNEKGIFRVG